MARSGNQRDPWALALKGAMNTWVRYEGPKFGFKYMEDLARFLGIPHSTWNGIAAGKSVSMDKRIYAGLFLIMGIPEADPRNIAEGRRRNPQGSFQPYERKMNHDEWVQWLETDPMAAKIRELRAQHGHPVGSTNPEQIPDVGSQEPVPPDHVQLQTPSSPVDRTDTGIKELPAPQTIPYQFTAGQLLDMLLATTGTDLAEIIAAQTAQRVDAAIAARFDERERFIETTLRVVTTILPRLQTVVDGIQPAEQTTPATLQPELSDDLIERISERTGEKAAEQVISWLQGELGALKPKRRGNTRATDQLSIGEMAEALIEQLQQFVAPDAAATTRDQLEDMFGEQLIRLLSLTETLTLKGEQREEAIRTKHQAGGEL